jgi:hypothetical protein
MPAKQIGQHFFEHPKAVLNGSNSGSRFLTRLHAPASISNIGSSVGAGVKTDETNPFQNRSFQHLNATAIPRYRPLTERNLTDS